MVNQFNYVTCPKCSHDRNSLTAKKCEICGTRLGKGRNLLPIAGVGLAAVLLAGGGYYAFGDKLTGATDGTADSASSAADPNQAETTPVGDVAAFLSRGEKVLFTDAPNPDKQAATEAYATGDFSTATTKLQAARQAMRNDPETLIYLNNARLGDSPALTIAAIVPITSRANPARELLRGVAQAQDEAIQAGVPLRVVIGDDANEPERARAIANALVQDSSILAVIGHGTSRTSLEAAPIYQQGQLTMIAPTSTSTDLTQVSKGPNGENSVFRTIPSDQFTGTALARYALAQGKRQVAVFFNSQSSYSKSLLEAFSTTLGLEGGQITAQVDLSEGNAAAQLASINAQAIVLLPDSETLTQAIEVAKANSKRLPILAGDAFYTIESLQQGGATLNGAVLPVPWHPLKSANAEFTRVGSSLWGGDVNWRTALSYDAVQTIRTARSIGKVTPQMGVEGRAALNQALGGSGFSAKGTTGAISFLPSGDRNSKVMLVKVQPGTRSGTGFDFVPFQ